jgi:hypothetical protein
VLRRVFRCLVLCCALLSCFLGWLPVRACLLLFARGSGSCALGVCLLPAACAWAGCRGEGGGPAGSDWRPRLPFLLLAVRCLPSCLPCAASGLLVLCFCVAPCCRVSLAGFLCVPARFCLPGGSVAPVRWASACFLLGALFRVLVGLSVCCCGRWACWCLFWCWSPFRWFSAWARAPASFAVLGLFPAVFPLRWLLFFLAASLFLFLRCPVLPLPSLSAVCCSVSASALAVLCSLSSAAASGSLRGCGSLAVLVAFVSGLPSALVPPCAA